VFQLHGACANGTVIFRKKLTRVQLLAFMSQQSACVVAMEACATAHSWGREFEKLGHTVRLIAPNYVKPFVKRQKNDVADAEAIVEAASRPTMRFVALKSEAQQASLEATKWHKYPKTEAFSQALPVFEFPKSNGLRLWVLPFCLQQRVLILPPSGACGTIDTLFAEFA
jgi:hypothetical protein